MNLESRDNLKVRLRCGLRLCNCQSRFTVLWLTPWAFARVRQLQCVMPLGLVSRVAAISASLLLNILGLASPAGLNLPERTDPGGAHALAPQGSGMAIDVIGGSNFQILLAGGRRQDQAAAQGHLLRRAGRPFPPDHLLQLVGG